MKVTLIYARQNTSTHCPLGILWVASVLEEAGHRVQVIDPLPGNTFFIEDIKNFKPDLIGLSILTPEYLRASNLVKIFKREIPEALLCAGGVHPTALPIETIKDLGLDFVVMGEGENTMLEVCNNLEEKRKFNGIYGIAYKEDKEIKINPLRPLIQDLNKLPFPARHLINMDWYLTPPGLMRGAFLKRTLGIMATRGCPYNCIFCSSNIIFGRTVRRRSIENVINEIEFLMKEYKIDGFYFYDDTFTLDPKYVIKFCNVLKERDIDLKWGCQVRVNTIFKDVLMAMRESGCIQVDVGVESGSDRILKNLRKDITTQMTKNAFHIIHQSKIRVMATFIVGNPGETIEDIEKTRQLAHVISPNYIQFFYLTPFPGSELYRIAKENKWINNDMIFSSKWQIRQVDDPLMTINFSTKDLRKIRARLQNEFLLKNYLSIIREWKFMLLMGFVLLRHPLELMKMLLRTIKTRRMDNIIEFTLELYRIDKAIELEKRRKIKF